VIAGGLIGGDHAAATPVEPPIVRDRFLVGVGVDLGTAVLANAWLGWMIAPDLGVFASATGGETIDAPSLRFLAIGARYWLSPRWFTEARLGRISVAQDDCGLISGPCKLAGVGFSGGLGVELFHSPHASLALHVGFVAGPHDALLEPVLWGGGGVYAGLAVHYFGP
jgi:hypothetical protein